MSESTGMSCLARIVPPLAACLLIAVVAACSPAAAPDEVDATAEPTAELSGGYAEPEPELTPTADPAPSPEPTIATEPPGDCWGGALSKDPLHCYVLEEAQRAGKIKVVAVYEQGGGIVHVFLEGGRPLSWISELSAPLARGALGREITGVFHEKAREFLAGPLASEYYFSDYNLSSHCGDRQGREWQECVMDPLYLQPEYDWEHVRASQLVPPFTESDQIYLYPGGAEARRAVGGWGSWTRLWPAADGSQGEGVSGSGGFDVSDVDTTNIPEPDCDRYTGSQAGTCERWKNDPGSRLAGTTWDDKLIPYVQVKVPPALPTGRAEINALKRRLVPQLWKGDYASMVLIPVKYDFGDMWRAMVILERFARSAGNTIGLAGAFIGYNTDGYRGDEVFLSGYADWGGGYRNVGNIRATVVVEALEVQEVVDALPEMLPLLGIPVDAVGLVIEHVDRPLINIVDPE